MIGVLLMEHRHRNYKTRDQKVTYRYFFGKIHRIVSEFVSHNEKEGLKLSCNIFIYKRRR